MPIEGEFYLVKIGTITLSDDGTDSGTACLTKVDGLAKLFGAYVGSTRIPFTGRAWNFIAENNGANVKLLTKPFVIENDTLEDLRDLIDTANSAASQITVIISNGPGAVSVDCDPLFEGEEPPIRFSGNFADDDVYEVQIALITRGFTPEGP